MLAGCQEGQAGEQVRVPEGDLPVVEGLDDEAFPGIVFQNEVAEQLVVRDAHTPLAGKRSPGLEGKEVVHRQKGPAPQSDGPEKCEGEDQKE